MVKDRIRETEKIFTSFWLSNSKGPNYTCDMVHGACNRPSPTPGPLLLLPAIYTPCAVSVLTSLYRGGN